MAAVTKEAASKKGTKKRATEADKREPGRPRRDRKAKSEAAARLGAKAREMREAKGLRAVDLAEAAGVPVSCIYELEAGANVPRLPTVCRVDRGLKAGGKLAAFATTLDW